MESIFRNSALVAGSLVVGALIMFFAERYAIQNQNLSVKRGLGVGLFQSLALIPGFSRSGMTISGGLFLGLDREAATRFSFLLAFPILFGSGIKKLLDLGTSGVLDGIGWSLLAGSIASFIVGLLAIHFLIRYLKNNTLNIFVVYRIILAVVILIWL